MIDRPDSPWNWRPIRRTIMPGVWLIVLALPAFLPGMVLAQAAQDQEKADVLNALARHKIVQLPGLGGQREARVPKPLVDQLVFRQDPSPEAARRRLELALSYEIAEIDRTCTITPVQKEKLQLIGLGDINRFFHRYETLISKYDDLEIDGLKMAEIVKEVEPLQLVLHYGLYHYGSLLHKSLAGILTAEQFTQYRALIRGRLNSHHNSQVRSLVDAIGRTSPLSEASRQKLTILMTREIKPNRVLGPYGLAYLLWQLGRIPEDKLRPLLDDAQWEYLRALIVQYKPHAALYQKGGFFIPDGDDEHDLELPAETVKK